MTVQQSPQQQIAPARTTLASAAQTLWRAVLRALAVLRGMVGGLLGSPRLLGEISYAEVLSWLVENRVEGAESGAALRRRCAGGVEVVVLYLGADQQPLALERGLTTATFRAARLDTELESAFGNQRLVIFR